MTLILGMSKAEGIYMSTDYRVTDARTGEVIDDASTKFLTVHYPPVPHAPKALFGYTGLAILPDGTPMGTWIRETLRGEFDEVIDRSMHHLQERLNRDVAGERVPLIINVLVTEGERRLVGGFTNVSDDGTVKDSFAYHMHELTQPTAFANGSGAARVVADRHTDLLRSQVRVWPRRIEDHLRLLAAVNRRVAAGEQSVSPFCHVAFINADERTSAVSKTFLEQGESVPFAMPLVVHGIDASEMMRRFVKEAGKGDTVSAMNLDEVNKELKRRP
jgi:hypothetical protein